MERPEPLSSRSLNKPIPSSSILKRTIQTPSTIRKATNTIRPSSPNKSSPSKTSSPGKGSPTRQWSSTLSMQTPRQRPQSLVEQFNSDQGNAPPTIRQVPSTIQRVHQMFNSNPPSPTHTPARPAQTHNNQDGNNDLLISFETPTSNRATTPGTTRKTLLELDLDDFFQPTPHRAHTNLSLTELMTTTLESERQKWLHESEMRHAADLEALAADLHTQYREKHTRKVEALKLTYKRQYEKKITALEERVKELEGVVEGLKSDLEKEGQEKRELIEMSEELMRLTGQGNE